MFAPLFGEFAIEGLFEEGLAINAELPPRATQTLLPDVEFGEEFLDLRDDPPLLGEGWEGDGEVVKELSVDSCKGRSCSLFRDFMLTRPQEPKDELFWDMIQSMNGGQAAPDTTEL